MSTDLTPPTIGRRDRIYDLVKAAIGEAPGGGLTAEVLGTLFGQPLQKRRDEWAKRVVAAIDELQQSKIDIEKLVGDPAFVDTVAQASRVALCTAEQERLDALQNAIVNSGLPRAIEPDLRQMFFGMVERFTPWHIRILSLFENPREWFTKNAKQFNSTSGTYELAGVLNQAFPELHTKKVFREQVWAELRSCGLLQNYPLDTQAGADGAVASRTTEFGKQFIRFIKRQE